MTKEDREKIFQLSVDMVEVKSDIKYIKNNLPICEKHTIKAKISNNEKLIFLLLATYIPAIIGLIFTAIQTFAK